MCVVVPQPIVKYREYLVCARSCSLDGSSDVSFHHLCQHCRNLLLTCDCRFHHDCVCVMNCRRRRSAGRAACPSPLMFTRHRAVIQRQRSDCQQITPQSPTESPTSDQQNCCLPRHVCIQVCYFVYLYPLAQGFSTCGP